MKIAVLIPDRNDRPRLLANCLRMMNEQTMKPDIVEVVNDAPLGPDVDITWRYRMGYDRLRGKNIDAILFIENDDWYHREYIELMVGQWESVGRPNMLGHNYTIYYHIKKWAYFTMHHDTRSSAMNSLIRPDMNFKWCSDKEAYTDMWLWENLKGVTFKPYQHLCMGIKHGEGLCGGHMHTSRMTRYEGELATQDPNKDFLRQTLDPVSFDFYSNYFNT